MTSRVMSKIVLAVLCLGVFTTSAGADTLVNTLELREGVVAGSVRGLDVFWALFGQEGTQAGRFSPEGLFSGTNQFHIRTRDPLVVQGTTFLAPPRPQNPAFPDENLHLEFTFDPFPYPPVPGVEITKPFNMTGQLYLVDPATGNDVLYELYGVGNVTLWWANDPFDQFGGTFELTPPVPEPPALVLLAIGGVVLAAYAASCKPGCRLVQGACRIPKR